MNEPVQITVVDDLDSLFRLHYGRLVRTLTVVAGDREAAADAVQEAFVKAHLRWKKVKNYDDPVGWIRRVAINNLRDGHRRTTRKAAALRRVKGLTGAEAHEQVDQGGNSETVLAMLEALPRQQRLCAALFYVDEMSVAEIAALLELSEGAVKFHLHKSRERLRAVYDTGRDVNEEGHTQ